MYILMCNKFALFLDQLYQYMYVFDVHIMISV